MIATDLQTNDIPGIYQRFAMLIGQGNIKAQEKKLKEQLRRDSHLKMIYENDFQVVLELAKCAKSVGRNGLLPMGLTTDRSIYAGMGFAAQILGVVDSIERSLRKGVIDRVKHALKNPEEMRALRLELMIASHFERQGQAVQWPEMIGGNDCTVDLLLPDLGANGCEVECKAISRDKGKKIHRDKAQSFLARVKSAADGKLNGLTSHLAAVVTVPDRLPSNVQLQTALAKGVVQAVLTDKTVGLSGGAAVEVSEIDPDKIEAITQAANREELSYALDAATNTRNEQCMIMSNKVGGSLLCVVRSSRPDDFGGALRTTLKQSAKNQASGNRALFFVVSLQDLEPEELESLIAEDQQRHKAPTVLAEEASKLMQSTSCPYVVGLSFLSGRATQPRVDGVSDDSLGGRSYSFVRHESEFFDEEIADHFRLTRAADQGGDLRSL